MPGLVAYAFDPSAHVSDVWQRNCVRYVFREAQVPIFEYRERFMQPTLALIDDWCSIGSSNLDHWSLRWNLEAN